MKEVVFEEIREEVKREISDATYRINELKKIKKDLIIDEQIIDEVKIVMDVFNRNIDKNTDNTSDIYYFTDKYFLKQKEDSDEWVTHELYVNLESGKTLLIPEDECNLFEREHIVLDSVMGYEFLKRKFVLNQYKTNENTARDKMVKRYRKKIY